MKIVYSICIGALFLISNVLAQTTGKIAGEVRDAESEEPLAGVNIIVEGTYLGDVSAVDGSFYILNVPPGTYTISFEMIGYEIVKMENLRVSVNRTAYASAELKQTILQEEVIVVQADKLSIKKDQTGSIKTVSSEDMSIMPIENVDAVVNLQAGIVNGHFRGGRRTEVSYMVDGLQVDETFGGEGRTVTVEADAVSEVEVITGNFNAEYGRAMSGIVNTVIKDGTPDFQISASYAAATYLTTHYSTSSYNNDHDKVFSGLQRIDPVRNQDYKLSISGPIYKDKVLFFINTRYQNNKNYLNGIRRFKVDDYSDFSDGAIWISETNGNGEYVPMNDSKNFSLLSKVTFNLWDILKASLMYTKNKDEWNDYNHQYKYDPDGVPSTFGDTDMFQMQLNHTLGRSAFYTINVSYISNYHGYYLFKDPRDSGYVHDGYRINASHTGFYTGGQSKDHDVRKMDDLNVKFDFTWQMHRQHSIKFGIMGIQHWLDKKWQTVENYYDSYPPDLPPGVLYDDWVIIDGKITYPYYKPFVLDTAATSTDIYKVKPYEYAAFIQDKMELEDMTLNLGLRFDYFNAHTIYPTDRRNPDNSIPRVNRSEYPNADAQIQLSPRFSLAYTLGKRAVLRFSYGHFFQMPPMYALYQNRSFLVNPEPYATTMGNAQLKAQKTVQYELGLWQELFDGFSFEVALYYRDIYNLLSAVVVTTYNQTPYGLYSNKDYGNTKGLEMKAEYTLADWYANLNYTLQYTRGNADNPTQTFDRAGSTTDPVNKLIVMSWDQRHTLNATLGYNKPDYGFSTILSYGSGSPYTWVPVSTSRLIDINLPPNNDYTPARFNVDVNVFYRLAISQRFKLEFELRIYNLFDRLNEYGVDQSTGRTATRIVQETDIGSHHSDFNNYYDRIKDPSGYSAPRMLKLGVSVLY